MPDLIKKFFDTFEIEPKPIYSGSKLYNPFVTGYDYPTITDRILLELICMANQHEDYPATTNIKNIQARTLRILLRIEKFYKNYYGNDKRYKKLVKQVQKLFKGE